MLNNQHLVNGDFLTTNNYSNASILTGLPSVQELLQQVWSWDCLMNNKQTTQIGSLYPLSFFESHPDPLQHFMDFFCFRKCLLLNHFGRWTTPLHLFLSFAPHCELGPHLGRYNKYFKGINFHVKESSFN